MGKSTQNPGEPVPRFLGTAGLAEHLGVSRWTVSRVLNGHSGVKESTRQRILEAVEAFGFEPNRLARGLRGLPSGLVGVSFPFLEAAILAEKSRVLQEALGEAGYRGIFEIPKGNPEVESEVIRHFLSINVEGIVLIAPTLEADDPVLREVLDRGVGIVAVDPRNQLPVSTVCLNRQKAMLQVMEHLHGLGHRRIAVLGLGSDDMYRNTRLKGLKRAASKLKLRIGEELLFIDEEGYSWRNYAFGAVLAEKVLRMEGAGQLPTALVCLNDRLAIGAMKALRCSGKSIPGDMSVVGFDNVAESGWMYPALTTIDQSVGDLMGWVVSALWESIQGNSMKRKEIDPVLVERESTGPARRETSGGRIGGR